jgi:hypothetical protein
MGIDIAEGRRQSGNGARSGDFLDMERERLKVHRAQLRLKPETG